MLSIDHLLKRKLELSNYFKSEIITHPSPGRKENVDDKFIRKVINIIESNISNPALSVEMISDENRRESHTFVPKAKIIDPFFSERNHQKVSDKKSFAVIKNKEGPNVLSWNLGYLLKNISRRKANIILTSPKIFSPDLPRKAGVTFPTTSLSSVIFFQPPRINISF